MSESRAAAAQWHQGAVHEATVTGLRGISKAAKRHEHLSRWPDCELHAVLATRHEALGRLGGVSFPRCHRAGWLRQSDQLVVAYLREENRVLRKLLAVEQRRWRFTDEQRRRLAVRAQPLGVAVLRELVTLVTPETLLRWYRLLWWQPSTMAVGSAAPGAHRPRPSWPKLVLEMARDNPTWGYTRLRGALCNVGHELGRNTIVRILRDARLEPAPERTKRPSWSSFLKAHWGAIAATDFFSVEVMTGWGIVRYHVFFVIDLKTRTIETAGITHDLHQNWVKNALRALLDPVDGFLKGTRKLIHDRDPVFGMPCDRVQVFSA